MKVTIDGVEMDMDPGDLPAFTYAIADPLDPASIKGTRSTTFKFPGTNRNKLALGSEQMSEDAPSADPQLRIGIEGQTFVDALVRPIEWEENEIRAVAVANNATWATSLRGVKVRDLDLGDSETIDAAYIASTWEDEERTDYYPLINYGYDFTGGIVVQVQAVRPALRAWRVLSKAFNDVGYTLKATGSFASVWKKYVLPAVNEPVIAASLLDENRMTVVDNTPSSTTWPDGGDPTPLPMNVDSLTDPGNNVTSVKRYLVPFNMWLTVRFRATGTWTRGTSIPVTGAKFQILKFGGVASQYFVQFQPGFTEFNLDFEMPVVGYALGDVLTFCYTLDNPDGDQVEFTSATVEWVPTRAPYGEGVKVDLAKSGPDMNVLDILKGMSIHRMLAVSTDDIAKTCEIGYYDERYIAPEVGGVVMVGREDFTDKPVKMEPLKPKRYLYKWKEDSKDKALEALDELVGERGWGGYILNVPQGVLDDKKVDIPFAATAMRYYDSLFIPVMETREQDSTTYKEEYKWQPRLLISDGLARGEWTFDGDALEEYPKCFFVFPGETDLCCALDEETEFGSVGPGMVSLHHQGFIRRLTRSKFLEIDLFLYDDELPGIDFGAPILVHDGYEPGWYYLSEIKQKRYGLEEPTRVELIQV
jgi:hypothetical protein